MVSENKDKILDVNNKPLAIIIEPTRELTMQVYEQAKKLAHQTGVRVVKCYGKYDLIANQKEIYGGSDIIVGTPGRLMNFVESGVVILFFLEPF
jgi:superfamily II DNA/RNA helicase